MLNVVSSMQTVNVLAHVREHRGDRISAVSCDDAKLVAGAAQLDQHPSDFIKETCFFRPPPSQCREFFDGWLPRIDQRKRRRHSSAQLAKRGKPQ